MYVISHGECPEHDEFRDKCNYIVVPRKSSDYIDRRKALLLGGLTTALLSFYDVVICGDVDELIVCDPRFGANLSKYLLALPSNSIVAPLGFNVVSPAKDFDRSDPAVTIEAPILRQVNWVVFSPQHCKPSVFKRPAILSGGQHGLIGSDFSIDPNMMLFHLKWAGLNDESYHDDLAKEVLKERQLRGLDLQKLWSEGFAGLKKSALAFGGEHGALPVLEPQEAAEGCYALPKAGLRRWLNGRPSPYRVIEKRSSKIFALPERWLDAV